MSSPTPGELAAPTAVVPGLYIGDKRLAANKDALHALGITHIVNVTHDVRHYFEHEPHSFTYLRCPCHDTDTADLHAHFAAACQFIRAALIAGHAALVHCQQGVSRSAAMATAYLIQNHRMSLRDAYVRVKASRPTVKVNANFLRQLMRWETECRQPQPQPQPQPQQQRDEQSQPALPRSNQQPGTEHAAGDTAAQSQQPDSRRRKRPQQDSAQSGQGEQTDVHDGEAEAEEKRQAASFGKRQRVAELTEPPPASALSASTATRLANVDGGGDSLNRSD